MAGTTSAERIVKIIHIAFAIIDLIAFIVFFIKSLTINYANIYQYSKSSSIENLPLYVCMAIVLFITFIISVGFLLICKKVSIKIIFVDVFFVVAIIIALIISPKIPNVNEYVSSGYNQEQVDYFPIDEFKYNEDSEDYYYYREVNFGDVYWIGSSSYKNFTPKNATDTSSEEIGQSVVFMNYYYLNDENGFLTKDYSNKKIWYDMLYVNDYESEQKIDDYTVYEYEDSYEVILESENEVFYLSASKNERTEYGKDYLIDLARKFNNTLRENSTLT